MNLKFKTISTFKSPEEFYETNHFNTGDQEICIFHGESIDERGEVIISYFNAQAQTISNFFIKYLQDDDIFNINEDSVKSRTAIDVLKRTMISFKHIIIDSTTLSYIELVTLLFTISQIEEHIIIEIFYVEPEGYNQTSLDEDISTLSFELSDDMGDLTYIKPFLLGLGQDSLNKEKTSLIAFLGFEDNRLENILDNENFIFSEVVPILPVPAFKYGWENISLRKHYPLLLNKSLSYVPADNPYAVYKKLYQLIQNIDNKQIIIIPLGTKPNAIGTAIFMVNYKNNYQEDNNQKEVATVYDFPLKTKKRTTGIHLIQKYLLHNY